MKLGPSAGEHQCSSYQKTSANCAGCIQHFENVYVVKIWKKKWRSDILVTRQVEAWLNGQTPPWRSAGLPRRNQEKLGRASMPVCPKAECIGIDITDSSAQVKIYWRALSSAMLESISWSTMQAMGSLKFDRLPMSKFMLCLKSYLCPHARFFTLDGCAWRKQAGAHRQHRRACVSLLFIFSLRPLWLLNACG